MTNRILFGVIAAAVLIGISYFSAKTYAVGFRFNGMQMRAGFFTSLLVPLVFAASILVRKSTVLGAPLYGIIQIITGVGLYLFIGAIVLFVTICIAAVFHFSVPTAAAWIVLCASLCIATIGFIERYAIVVRNYTVTLPDAPAAWIGKKAVLVSDTHFGLINSVRFSNKVVQKILSLHPDFVLHAGDFYDGPMVPTTPISDSWKKLSSQLPVFYAPGNHELYGNYAAFIDSIRAAGITVLDDKKTEYDGVQIAGITYRSGKDDAGAAAAIASLAINPEIPAILINHPPTSLAAAAEAGFDLQVSGHTHNGQFWPMNYLIKRIYGAYAHGSVRYDDMTVITSSGIGTFGPPFRTFNRPELVLIEFK